MNKLILLYVSKIFFSAQQLTRELSGQVKVFRNARITTCNACIAF